MPARKVVLIVEDEALLRMSAADMIEAAGYEVIEAMDADEAVRILESRDDIRIVFTDIDMPGSMDGLKLAACIRGRWPPVEIIATSGHCTPEPAALPERAVFVPKPYGAAQILPHLERMAA